MKRVMGSARLEKSGGEGEKVKYSEAGKKLK